MLCGCCVAKHDKAIQNYHHRNIFRSVQRSIGSFVEYIRQYIDCCTSVRVKWGVFRQISDFDIRLCCLSKWNLWIPEQKMMIDFAIQFECKRVLYISMTMTHRRRCHCHVATLSEVAQRTQYALFIGALIIIIVYSDFEFLQISTRFDTNGWWVIASPSQPGQT